MTGQSESHSVRRKTQTTQSLYYWTMVQDAQHCNGLSSADEKIGSAAPKTGISRELL